MAVVGFVVLLPEPAVGSALDPMTWRLDGLGARADEHGPSHVAEAMCFAVWNPSTGQVSTTVPDPDLHPKLRIENFSAQVEDAYRTRFAGAPPHQPGCPSATLTSPRQATISKPLPHLPKLGEQFWVEVR
jgi:hypothetical protein